MELKKFLKQIYRNILKIMPTKIALNIDSLRGYHKLINFKNPKYFGEKIQWLKLNGNLERYTNYADKYKVREFVTKKIGEEYLIPLIGVYGSTDEIGYEKLPKKCVLKLNTGSGYNLIITDKESTNIKRTNEIINKWLKEDYYKIKKEPQYKNIEKKILCEKYIADKEGKLQDYKFYCFDGKIEFVEVDFDRFKDHRMNFYDLNWNLLNIRKGNYKNYPKEFSKPKNFNKMIEIAEKLSEDFQFVRVDLYNVNGTIYFGELTFTPAGGLTPFTPIEKDLEYAKKLEISKHIDKNILLIARTSEKRNILDGVTVKARILRDYLEQKKGINTFTIDVDNWKKSFLGISIKILKLYKKTDKIVICSSSPGASIVLKFLKMIHCKKEVYYFVSGGNLAEKIAEGKYKLDLYKNLTKMYVESDDMLHRFQKLGLKNIEVIPNFRKVDKFKNKYKKSNKIKFVFFGRVIKTKGIEQSIELIKKLNGKSYNTSLDIYGQVEENYLKELNSKIGDNKNIKYCGAIKPNGRVEYEILSEYDIFILPTEHPGEGLPGALIDAYIAGLSVLVSNWRYAKEYVIDNKNGRIFEYKDYDDMYQKALDMMDREIIENYKKKSLEISKKYIVDNVLTDFITLLLEENK